MYETLKVGQQVQKYVFHSRDILIAVALMSIVVPNKPKHIAFMA